MGFRLANVDGRAALVASDRWYDLERVSGGEFDSDPMGALARGAELAALSAVLDEHEPDGSLDDADLGPPVPRPRNCYGIGLNYRRHAEESGMDVPDTPVVFTKYPSCISGPTADIELRSEAADYEVELVVVIGAGGRDIAVADAWDRVVGLTVGNDVSDRALQFAATPPHFGLGKSRDGYGPIGPVLVSPDELDDPDDVHVTCDVNGERRQDDRSSDLIFTVSELVAYLSSISTLAPGDIIFTGTPAGVGFPQGKVLVPGDVITTTIEGIGSLVNRCV